MVILKEPQWVLSNQEQEQEQEQELQCLQVLPRLILFWLQAVQSLTEAQQFMKAVMPSPLLPAMHWAGLDPGFDVIFNLEHRKRSHRYSAWQHLKLLVITMFMAYVVKDLKRHRVVHHELHDFTRTSKFLMRLKMEWRSAFLRLRYNGINYSIQSSCYNSEAAFRTNNPGL